MELCFNFEQIIWNYYRFIVTADFINVRDVTMSKSASLKYLRVPMDGHLTFNMQIREKCQTAARNVYLISCIRDYLSMKPCHQLVLALEITEWKYDSVTEDLMSLYWLPT